MQVNTPLREDVITQMKTFRDQIISCYQRYEPAKQFERTSWDYKEEGGGEITRIRGDVFEKAACNFSAISGSQFPGKDAKGPFFATGVSTITHMQNPKAPTFHFNVRYIETEKEAWIGGGFDMTPMGFTYDEDNHHLHACAKEGLDSVDSSLYPNFSSQARDYFFIPHRHKERGSGGIFFDHFSLGSFEKNLNFLSLVTQSYLKVIPPILERRLTETFSDKDKARQNMLRAHYVEFNLIYDRGTRFGFLSGGNPDAILCSMPPTACW